MSAVAIACARVRLAPSVLSLFLPLVRSLSLLLSHSTFSSSHALTNRPDNIDSEPPASRAPIPIDRRCVGTEGRLKRAVYVPVGTWYPQGKEEEEEEVALTRSFAISRRWLKRLFVSVSSMLEEVSDQRILISMIDDMENPSSFYSKFFENL